MNEAPERSRRRLVVTIALALVALLAVAGAVGYFVFFRVSTRGPGEVGGGKAVDFTLPNHLGETTTLAGLVEHGPAVLVFYRGHW